jgi:hypothetical protein
MMSPDGTIGINLGVVFVAKAMPAIGELLMRLLADKRPKTIAEVTSFPVSVDFVREIEAVVIWYREAHRNNWQQVRAPRSLSAEDSEFANYVDALIVYHEFGHLLEVYNPALYAQRLERARKVLGEWLSENESSLADGVGLSRAGFTPEILENWAREMDADQTAFGTLCQPSAVEKFAGKSPEQLAERILKGNASMALFYFVLEVLEFASLPFSDSSGAVTHPPAELRRELFMYMHARKSGLDYAEFVTQRFGGFYVPSLVLGHVFSAFLNKHCPADDGRKA